MTRARRRALVTALSLALAVPLHARLDADEPDFMDPNARACLERAAAEFQAKHYDLAIKEFSTGHQIEPRREFLFGWAQAERLRGNCAEAVRLYRAVLASSPSPQQADLARHHLRNCEQLLPGPWYKNVAGDVLTLTGLGILGAGIGLYVISNEHENTALTAETYPDYLSNRSTGSAERIAGIVSLAAGSAFIVGGVLAYAIGGKAKRKIIPVVGR